MNKFLSQTLYNEDLKNKFLNEYGTGTTIFYKYVFQISHATETQLDKDIYEFNDQQLRSLIGSYKNGSLTAVQSVVSVLKKYLDFCVNHGYIRINLLQDLSGYNDYIEFVDKTAQKNKYISKAELENIVGHCSNYQDAIIPVLMFYGIKGEDCSEAINLKHTHINKMENKIYIEGRDQWIDVDDFCMDILINAMEETQYNKSNGDENVTMKSRIYNIYPTDYVLKVAARDNGNEPIKPINLTSRLNRIKELWGNPYLTLTSIWYSGMLEMAKNIQKEKNITELEKEDYIKINERFGFSAGYWHVSKQRLQEMLMG
jgi:hypothetical protein